MKNWVISSLALIGFSFLLTQTSCLAEPTPTAFLDSATRIDLQLPTAVAPSSLSGHISVVCGGIPDRVVGVEAAASSGPEAAPTDPSEVVLAGDFQQALGGSAWQPNDKCTLMHERSVGRYDLVVNLPAGNYSYKVTRGGSWEQNWGAGFESGGSNIRLSIARASWVRFVVDFNRRFILNSVDDPGQVSPPNGPDLSAPSRDANNSLPTRYLVLHLGRPIAPADIARPIAVQVAGAASIPVFARDVLNDPAYVYHGDDLGSTYTRTLTTFKVWCPISSSTALLLYSHAEGGSCRSLSMRRGPSGVWTVSVPGDLNGVFYQYRFFSYGAPHIAPDLYGRAAGPDLRRSMVIDLSRTNPEGWGSVLAPRLAEPTDAVVYELHIRDFTVDPTSGAPAALRGKYLGLVKPGMHIPGGTAATGLDYLRRLGVNYVHVLPIQSIYSRDLSSYNWGYATDLFNVPEPRYATNSNDPGGVIRQVKSMVLGLHRAHLGLVMDVVYNHSVPVEGDASPFWATVPYYYFRNDFDGRLQNDSGVGNALDDDRPMVKKFIRDSLVYWEQQYHVDGFRFDLLGTFAPQTVRSISDALHRVRPDILLYGEPWTGGGPTRFGKGAQRGLRVAVFNDNFRNTMRGDLDGRSRGFALGGGGDPASLRTLISGSPDFASTPAESMNYVSIHDNTSLVDKIHNTLPSGDPVIERSALKFAGALVILSQGVPILEGGAEMGRTKGGNNNSYSAGDAVNRFDWQRGLAYRSVETYYHDLIALRLAHPAFRCKTAGLVRQTLTFLSARSLPPNTVAFTLKGSPTDDPWKETLVVFHGATEPSDFILPTGRWNVAIDANGVERGKAALSGGPIHLAPLTAYVFHQ